MHRVALLVLLVSSPALADSITLSPVGMAGPYKSQHDACVHATPCGDTEIDPKDQMKFIKPPKVASCSADDYNGGEAKLDHKVGDLTIQIASQACAVPRGIRWAHNIYYAFVKRTDGWWRSAPLWQFDYNDKYEAGAMTVRWNDQPGRTFAGVAAALSSGACMKHGNSTATIEMMVRVEPGTKSPVVFAPLVVGQRFWRELDKDNPPEPGADSFDCKPIKKTFELTEKWSGDDDLELSGAATWFGMKSVEGALAITVDDTTQRPSSIGSYHFAR